MTRKFIVIGGPSREDLFDCLRLANRHNRMFPVQFKVQETDYPLSLSMIKSLEQVGNEFTLDRVEWIIRAESTHIMSDYRMADDTALFTPYKVKIIYNTKTRQGVAFITRVRSKK